MKPSIGRIVHYTNLGDRDGRYPPEAQAAIITKATRLCIECLADGCKREASHFDAEGDNLCEKHLDMTGESTTGFREEERYAVSLRIFYETGDFFMKDVPFTRAEGGSEQARGSWTWPTRVGPETIAVPLPERERLIDLCRKLRCNTRPWRWLGEHDGQSGKLRAWGDVFKEVFDTELPLRLAGDGPPSLAGDDPSPESFDLPNRAYRLEFEAHYQRGWLCAAKRAGHLGDLEVT